MISVAALVVLIHRASWRGKISVTESKLRFEESALFEKRQAEWNPGTVKNIVVVAHEEKSEDSTQWQHYIAVTPDAAKERQWFVNREKPELEWIVTQLQMALELDVDWYSRV